MRQRSILTVVVVRYSEAFKLAVVREIEQGSTDGGEAEVWDPGVRDLAAVAGKVWQWQRGKGNSRGTTRRDQRSAAVAATDAAVGEGVGRRTIDLALERAYTQMACERAGIADVAEFKKKKLAGCPSGGRAKGPRAIGR